MTSKGRARKTADDVPQSVKDLLPDFLAGKFGKTEYAKRAGIARATLYKYLKLLNAAAGRTAQTKLTAEDVPQAVKDLLPRYKRGNLKKIEYAWLCGVSRPTLDKYLRLLLSQI